MIDLLVEAVRAVGGALGAEGLRRGLKIVVALPGVDGFTLEYDEGPIVVGATGGNALAFELGARPVLGRLQVRCVAPPPTTLRALDVFVSALTGLLGVLRSATVLAEREARAQAVVAASLDEIRALDTDGRAEP